MRTRKHKLMMAAGCLLVIGVACIAMQPWRRTDDESRYRQCCREFRLAKLLFPALNRRPSFVAWPVESVRRRLFGGIHEKEQLLLASGYLTNVSILLTNATKSRLAGSNTTLTVGTISSKLHNATSEYRYIPLSLRTDERSNVSVELQCRGKDVEFYRQVLASE